MLLISFRRMAHHDHRRELVAGNHDAKIAFHGRIDRTTHRFAALFAQPIRSRFKQLVDDGLVINRFEKAEKTHAIVVVLVVQVIFDRHDSPDPPGLFGSR
jgi:hypothetical protein